jgi:hypothetical protein
MGRFNKKSYFKKSRRLLRVEKTHNNEVSVHKPKDEKHKTHKSEDSAKMMSTKMKIESHAPKSKKHKK